MGMNEIIFAYKKMFVMIKAEIKRRLDELLRPVRTIIAASLIASIIISLFDFYVVGERLPFNKILVKTIGNTVLYTLVFYVLYMAWIKIMDAIKELRE